MPTLTIDLATRVLQDDMEVNLIHPGARYAFYNTVADHHLLPVDVPFLTAQDGHGLPDADQIEPELERAREMRRWAKRPLTEASKPRPTRDLDFYRTGLNLDAGAQGARTRLRNAAQEVLWEIPGGSLVVVPSRSIAGEAILAEMSDRTAPRWTVQGTGHYLGMEFLARELVPVAKVPMLALPQDVLGKARSTSAVQQIGGYDEDRLLRLAYGDYQRDSDYVAGIMANTDDFDALVMGQMIDLHVAIEHFLTKREALSPGKSLYLGDDVVAPFLHANINSPDGRASLESKGVSTFSLKILSIIAASGIPLSQAGHMVANAQVSVINSADPNGDTKIIQDSANALTSFFATSGEKDYTTYMRGLQNGLKRNKTTPQGTALIQP